MVQMSTAVTGCTHAMTRAVNTHEQGSIEQASLCSNRNQCVPLLLLSTAVVDLAQAPDPNVADMKSVFLAQAPWPVIWPHSPFAIRSNSKDNQLVHNRHMPGRDAHVEVIQWAMAWAITHP